jgi:hypothetical protein
VFVSPAINLSPFFYSFSLHLYWNLIKNGVTLAPPNANAEQIRVANESKLRDLKVKNYLFQSIDRSILETILVRDTTKDIWDAMKRKYQGLTKVKRA